ncbi:MAG: 5-formyltetrahydrofolate cyclo-ligase [Nevskiales bacterium]
MPNPASANPIADRDRLRRELRAKRRRLSPLQRQQAARAATLAFTASRSFRAAKRIALYSTVGSELDTLPLLTASLARGKLVFVPRIKAGRARRMDWVRAHPDSIWQRNRYGIAEPQPRLRGDIERALNLDLVLLPLLGFDARGHRLGSGVGFYDRALAFRLRRQRLWRRPRLIGLAFACQKVSELPAERWDVPLDGVLTEQGLELFR